jgi:hypothetical protein
MYLFKGVQIKINYQKYSSQYFENFSFLGIKGDLNLNGEND